MLALIVAMMTPQGSYHNTYHGEKIALRNAELCIEAGDLYFIKNEFDNAEILYEGAEKMLSYVKEKDLATLFHIDICKTVAAALKEKRTDKLHTGVVNIYLKYFGENVNVGLNLGEPSDKSFSKTE